MAGETAGLYFCSTYSKEFSAALLAEDRYIKGMSELSFLLALLSDFPAALKSHLGAAPAGALDFVPASWEGAPSESLTIRQQVCHLRDIEIDGYAVRFHRVLTEESPLLPSIDTYELVASGNYDRSDVLSAFNEFSKARLETVAMLADASDADLRRAGEFAGYGPVTLKGLIHFLVSHDQQHLAGIQWLLGKHASQK